MQADQGERYTLPTPAPQMRQPNLSPHNSAADNRVFVGINAALRWSLDHYTSPQAIGPFALLARGVVTEQNSEAQASRQ